MSRFNVQSLEAYLLKDCDGLAEEVFSGVNDGENTTYDLFSLILRVSHHQQSVLENREVIGSATHTNVHKYTYTHRAMTYSDIFNVDLLHSQPHS